MVKGTQGLVKGWADKEKRLVLLEFTVNIADKPQVVTHPVTIRNLKLTSEYLLEQGAVPGEPPKPTPSSSSDLHQGLEKVLGETSPENLKVLTAWKDLLADWDPLAKIMHLKGRVATGLNALQDLLPKYLDKDFLIVNRKNNKGMWKTEVWTKRNFEALEIQFAPCSSQLKETHLMATAHAVVTLPKHGRGAHPHNSSLALDGRSRNMLASKDMVDLEEHRGSLYWMVTRTSDVKEANLDVEMVKWEQSIQMTLPALKKRKAVSCEWSSSELPCFPILVNKEPLTKHTQLFCYLCKDEKKETKVAKK